MEAAWTRMDCTPYAGQTRAAPTLALGKALLMAPTMRPPTLSFGRTPEKELKERNRGKQRRSDSYDRNRGGGGKNGGGVALGAGVAQGAAEGGNLFATTGAVAAALAEATEGGGTAQEHVQRGTARQPPPACLRPRARTTAR